jgi:peptidoglycan/xylan/chitin deacetylase (PgdA/CDA1 family)
MDVLPVLMYHNVLSNDTELKSFSIHEKTLETQFQYLVKHNYVTLHFSELDKLKKIPQKSVIITFDDITINQLKYAVPLLEKYNLKASFFIPFYYIGKSDEWNGMNNSEPIMSLEQIKSLSSNIELGYHSYKHRHFSDLSKIEIENDFEESIRVIDQENLKVFPVIAYPFGNFPRKEPYKSVFFEIMQSFGIKYGLRIGNRINKFPFSSSFEINRIDIKGTENSFQFKWKLKVGKLF